MMLFSFADSRGQIFVLCKKKKKKNTRLFRVLAQKKKKRNGKGDRVFSRGSGGGRRPPPDFGGKRVPPRGGTHFDLGKKGYGGWLGVTRTYPHLGHHVRNPHQKKKGSLPGIIVKRI